MISISGPKPALQLAALALFCAALLASLHAITRDTIDKNQAEREAMLLAEVIPTTDQPVVKTERQIAGRAQTVWQLVDADRVIAVALPITAKGGYSGNIELLIGIDSSLHISGVRATKHRETPGLGDEIDIRRSDWINGFLGLSLDQLAVEKWAVKKDGGVFDQFTGATITPRAVVKSVRDTLVYSTEYRRLLFSPDSGSTTP